MRTLAPVSALAIVISLMLGGCVPSAPAASPTPEPSSTPVFASEEEALAAAEEAYAAYLAVIDEIHADGGAGVERLEVVATPEVTNNEADGFGFSLKENVDPARLRVLDGVVQGFLHYAVQMSFDLRIESVPVQTASAES